MQQPGRPATTFDVEGLTDPAYRARRDHIASLATGVDELPASIDYLPSEHATWALAVDALHHRWTDGAAPEILAAARRLDLPVNHVPQLADVSAALGPRSGFSYRAVPGLVPVEAFFSALASGRFLSTQYVRHAESPLYTPEPDIIHEVVGHGTCLAEPHLAMLHREAGAAMARMTTSTSRQFLANVFWFSIEFGVVAGPNGPRAYGAGLLSSVGELDWFRRNASVRPLDIDAMGTVDYDIECFQPILFGCRSLGELVDVVGEFFATASSDEVDGRIRVAARAVR